MNVNEIILISLGPASLPETWSGVPFCLMRELRNRGIIVREVDLEPHRYIKWLYNRIVMPFISLLVKGGELSIYRSIFFRIYQYILLTKEIKKYKSADFILGVSSFSIKVPTTEKPVILLSDWPFAYALSRSEIPPCWYHRYHIEWEKKCLLNATQIISLFPTCAKYINTYIGHDRAKYLGVNVVNNLMDGPKIDIIKAKGESMNIVFIGRRHYLQGAMNLLSQYENLKNLFPSLHIDVVGLTKDDFPENFLIGKNDIKFHGYLNKGNSEQCFSYYDILNNASLYVNTTPGWVGYTSMIEAMYYYTPVVVYPCREFIDEFGYNIDFGAYCSDNENLLDIIYKLLSDHHRFKIMCINAHNRVANYTWSNFVEEFLGVINKQQ